MTILGRLLAGLAVWFGVGAPLAVVVGRWLRVRSGPAPETPAPAADRRPLPPPPARRLMGGRARLSPAGVACALTVLALGVGAPASAEASPGSVLWPLRLTVENVRLVLTRQPGERARLHARYAERHVGALNGLLADEPDGTDSSGDPAVSAAVARLRFHTDGLARMLADEDADALTAALQVRRLAERSDGMRQRLTASQCGQADVCEELTRTASVARKALDADPAAPAPGGGSPVAGTAPDPDDTGTSAPVAGTAPAPAPAPAEPPATPTEQPSEPDPAATEPVTVEPTPTEEAVPPVEVGPEEGSGSDGSGGAEGSEEGSQEGSQGEEEAPPPAEAATEPPAQEPPAHEPPAGGDGDWGTSGDGGTTAPDDGS